MRSMAELQFFTGTMDSGKSTLALQTNHNHAARGRSGGSSPATTGPVPRRCRAGSGCSTTRSRWARSSTSGATSSTR